MACAAGVGLGVGVGVGDGCWRWGWRRRGCWGWSWSRCWRRRGRGARCDRRRGRSAVSSASRVGVGLGVPVMMLKFVFEISKKMLPTASIFIRAVVVSMSGIRTDSEPSLAVLAARTVGKGGPTISRERNLDVRRIDRRGRRAADIPGHIVIRQPLNTDIGIGRGDREGPGGADNSHDGCGGVNAAAVGPVVTRDHLKGHGPGNSRQEFARQKSAGGGRRDVGVVQNVLQRREGSSSSDRWQIGTENRPGRPSASVLGTAVVASAEVILFPVVGD